MIEVGVVIPTRFSRPRYLLEAIESVQSQRGHLKVHLIIGCPASELSAIQQLVGNRVRVVAESSSGGLAHKLDALLRETPKVCRYITWLGDDDRLTPGSLEAAAAALSEDPSTSLVFGRCDYIDPAGVVIGTNRSGQWAVSILGFGPQLIPQPGSLFRRDKFLEVNGLDDEFMLAFDYDFFLKLKKTGRLTHIDQTLAQFRWHSSSLSVSRRMESAMEASTVRRKHYSKFLNSIAFFWEPLIVSATWLAGKLVTMGFKSNKQKGRFLN